MSEKLACVKCGSPIGRQPGPGRPPIFCGPICRAQSAYEVRRIQRRLEVLELRRSGLRAEEGLRRELRDYLGRTRQEQLADIEQQIKADEDRLALLLAEPRGKLLPDKVGA